MSQFRMSVGRRVSAAALLLVLPIIWVYTFARQGSTWAQQAYVKASNPDANDQFGGSVALGGGSGGRPLTLAVGAVNESSSATGVNGNPADNSVAGSGAAYLY
mgnify:CR=1 FL=1